VRAYLDAVFVIYLVEQNPAFAPAVERWLLANSCDIVVSELTRMESLVVPVRNGDAALIAEFEDFYLTRVTEVVALTRPVLNRVVQIRAHSKFKTPDAIHLACAVEAGCDVFVTNDHDLTKFTGIRVELI
jgi:predicted nucleic acid-binding protein